MVVVKKYESFCSSLWSMEAKEGCAQSVATFSRSDAW